MTDTQQTPTTEPTIEEQVQILAAEYLDQASRIDGVPGNWSSLTLPAVTRPVLTDIDHQTRVMAHAAELPKREPSAEAIRKRDQQWALERRSRWTAKELGEALKKGNQ